ncbi:MAG: hypothetical protein ACRCWS_04090 [Propionibacteriaceae bacterium]
MSLSGRRYSTNLMALVGAVGHLVAALALAGSTVSTVVVLVRYLRALHAGSWPSSMRFITVPHQKIVFLIVIAQAVAMIAMFVLAGWLIADVAQRRLRVRAVCFTCLLVDVGAAGLTALVAAATAHGNRGYSAIDLSIPPLLATVGLCFTLGAVLVSTSSFTEDVTRTADAATPDPRQQ